MIAQGTRCFEKRAATHGDARVGHRKKVVVIMRGRLIARTVECRAF
jgi:hypothetical protein